MIIAAVLAMIGLGVFSLIVEIVGAIKAYEGKVYKYPLAIEFF